MVNLFSVHAVAVGTKVVDRAGVTSAMLTLGVSVAVAVAEVMIDDESNE